jgi:hypothetical protein
MKNKFFIKNKKGDNLLGPETLKIIVAVMCILILLLLPMKLYGISKNSKLEQATASLDNLYFKINKVENNHSLEIEYLIESPNKWWVVAWPFENEIPNQCIGNNCICICPGNSFKECNEKGTCRIVSEKIKTINENGENVPIKIESFIQVKISNKLENNENITLVQKTG